MSLSFIKYYNSSGTGKYRWGFQGQEKDDEMKGSGNSYNFTNRMHDSRLGRFLSIDPLASQYPFNSCYAFAENKVIAFAELEGLEIALPRLGPVAIPRTILTFPRAPTIPIPVPPSLPAPPIIFEPMANPIPAYPTAPTGKLSFESTIDWNNPPSSPEELGDGWQETTSSRNKSGKRDFKHEESGERLRWDPGKEGKPGWEGKDHWHRYNPNATNKRDLYLDRFGNPVSRGSNASHIGAGESFLSAIPGLIKDVQKQIKILENMRENLTIFDTDDWGPIKKIWDQIDVLEDYMDELKDYKEEWDAYEKEKAEYYKNCDCIN